MRAGVMLVFALVPLAACTLLTGVGDLTTGGADDAGVADSTPLNDVFAASDGTPPNDVDAGDASSDADAMPDAANDARDAADVIEPPPTPTGCVEDLLLGNDAIAGASADGIIAGTYDTYGYDATKAGSAQCVWLYAEAAFSGTVDIAVYGPNESGKRPGAVVALAAFGNGTVKKGWNSILLGSPIAIDPSTRLWIGVTASASGFEVREHAGTSCGDLYLRAAGGPSAPNPFPPMSSDFTDACNLLAYLSPAKFSL